MHLIDAIIAGKSRRSDTSCATPADARQRLADWRRELERLFGRPKFAFSSEDIRIADWTMKMYERHIFLRLFVCGSVASWRLQVRPIVRKDWGPN